MTLKSRTWREEKRESHRVDKARKGGRTKKHKRGSIGFFGLQCTLPVKQRQRKTEKDRETFKCHSSFFGGSGRGNPCNRPQAYILLFRTWLLSTSTCSSTQRLANWITIAQLQTFKRHSSFFGGSGRGKPCNRPQAYILLFRTWLLSTSTCSSTQRFANWITIAQLQDTNATAPSEAAAGATPATDHGHTYCYSALGCSQPPLAHRHNGLPTGSL